MPLHHNGSERALVAATVAVDRSSSPPPAPSCSSSSFLSSPVISVRPDSKRLLRHRTAEADARLWSHWKLHRIWTCHPTTKGERCGSFVDHVAYSIRSYWPRRRLIAPCTSSISTIVGCASHSFDSRLPRLGLDPANVMQLEVRVYDRKRYRYPWNRRRTTNVPGPSLPSVLPPERNSNWIRLKVIISSAPQTSPFGNGRRLAGGRTMLMPTEREKKNNNYATLDHSEFLLV